ncbi:MAG: MBL fold metallo-hydrolase [Anaerolineae bacterium]|jgi:glyoxylase-like metal-dependent hydrolase (beta-lactamase superfamily II)|nr:MBL fold metallo-hydrolase [Anaerolineae bacterium]
MQIERISEHIYWFQSEVYAQVTAGVIMGNQWAVVIDTLAIPEETLELRRFVEEELNIPVRYIINTHHHADHSWGNCFFPGAYVIAHDTCRKEMAEQGSEALKAAAEHDQQFKQTKLVLPHFTFSSGSINLEVGKKTLQLIHTPGHSLDSISVLALEDRILFAGDAILPIPFIADGDIKLMRDSLRLINDLSLENIVQGHGDVILRGEVQESVDENLDYLDKIETKVREIIRDNKPITALQKITIESCGKSRIALNGIAEELHHSNLRTLYKIFKE